MTEQTTYRSRGAAVMQLAAGIVAPVAISLPALLQPGAMGLGTQVFFIVLGIGLSALAMRCAWCAIHIEDHGLRVVNPFSTRRLRWADIEEFTLGRWGLLPRNCVIRLADGSRQGVWAISAHNPSLFRHDSAADGLVASLNDHLRRSR